MKKLKYLWKYYLKPILSGIDPNSKEGIALRTTKLQEDSQMDMKKRGKSK